MNNIKSINTYYKGYRLRSRLEARWAVFLDELNIYWEYEFDGFVLSNGMPYLPDFYLPTFNGGMYVEVKPQQLSSIELLKCETLCNDTGVGVWLAVGVPEAKAYDYFNYYEKGGAGLITGIPNFDNAYCQNRMYYNPAYEGMKTNNPHSIPKNIISRVNSNIIEAALIAKQARFEFADKAK